MFKKNVGWILNVSDRSFQEDDQSEVVEENEDQAGCAGGEDKDQAECAGGEHEDQTDCAGDHHSSLLHLL